MIKSDRLYLKPLGEEDVEMIRGWRNKYKDSFFDASEISKESQRAWYVKYKESQGTDQMFIICLNDNTHIGQCAIYNIDVANRTAIFGRFLLLEEFRHHGYAEEAVKAIMKYAFEELGLYKVKVEVFLENINALAIYARAGFKTSTKPIILMENINENYDPKEPFILRKD